MKIEIPGRCTLLPPSYFKCTKKQAIWRVNLGSRKGIHWINFLWSSLDYISWLMLPLFNTAGMSENGSWSLKYISVLWWKWWHCHSTIFINSYPWYKFQLHVMYLDPPHFLYSPKQANLSPPAESGDNVMAKMICTSKKRSGITE